MSKIDKCVVATAIILSIFSILTITNTYRIHKQKLDKTVDSVRSNCEYIGKGKRISYLIIQDTNFDEITEQVFKCDNSLYIINNDFTPASK